MRRVCWSDGEAIRKGRIGFDNPEDCSFDCCDLQFSPSVRTETPAVDIYPGEEEQSGNP